MAETPSQDDWDRQKDNFRDLYHRRKLPLQSQNGGPSVMQIMRDEHNFCAKLSQYEAQIRRWDMPKNLKRFEWAHIIAKMDDLKSGGVECRLNLAGSLVSADKIKQKRRRYLRAMPNSSTGTESLPSLFLQESPRFTLEILAPSGQWSPYREDEASVQIPRHAALSSSIIDTASRTLNVRSMQSNSSTVNCPEQCSIDKDVTRRSVPAISSDDALSISWPRDDVANVESYCHTEHMEAVSNPSQNTPAGASERNNSPRLPDYRSREIFNVFRMDLGMERGFTLSPSSQELLIPAADAARPPFSPAGELLTWSLVGSNADVSLSKYLEDSPFSILEKQIRNFSATYIGRSEQSYLMYECGYSRTQVPELTERHRGQNTTSIFREIASISSIAQMITNLLGQERSIQNHQFNKFVNCLDSLLPDSSMHEVPGYTGVFDASSLAASRLLESPFHRVILYSTINGFAGLSRFPELPLSQTYSSLLELVKSHPSFAVRSFIDNAFSAAVWNRNAQALGFLLRMTHGTSYAIDVNKEIPGRPFPRLPIMVAFEGHWPSKEGRLRMPKQCLETAKVLLKAGADPTAALRFLLSGWRCTECVPIGFIRQLLDRGAKPEWVSIQCSIRHANEAHTELLLAHIPPTSYQVYFQVPDSLEFRRQIDLGLRRPETLPILACIALYLENSTATRIIKSVLGNWPRSEMEKSFPDTYELTMDYTLIHACAKGNQELVEFLRPFVPQVSSAALVVAIRGRQQPLIEMLLGWGANENDMPIYLDPRSCHPRSSDEYSDEPDSFDEYLYQSYTPDLYSRNHRHSRHHPPSRHHQPSRHPSSEPPVRMWCTCRGPALTIDLLEEWLHTPLAEAIRSRNQSLVQKFEFTLSGADSRCIEQALEAAADVGDLDYLLMLLDRHCSEHMDLYGIHRTRALCLAIDQNRDDTVFALLNDGVDVRGFSIESDSVAKSKVAFPLLAAIKSHRKKLIEAILEYGPDLYRDHYIRAAALSGDVDIIKVLLTSQAVVSLRALTTALKSGNGNMLHILLDHFWRHNPLYELKDKGSGPLGVLRTGDLDLSDLVKSAAQAKDDTLLVSFLEHGARVDKRAIRAAIKTENSAILELLLAFAVRPDITLDALVELKNQTILRQWLSKGTGHFTESAFLRAMRLDKESFAILMQAFKARYPNGLDGWGGRLLKNAIRRGNSSLLKELLMARMDVNTFDKFTIMPSTRSKIRNDEIRSTPLGFAIYHKRGESIDHVQMLLDAGSELNGIARNAGHGFPNWKTPLLLAIETGDLNLVQVLLSRGADVNLAARNGRKRTPLQKACELCNLPMVELLLSSQADVNGEAAIIAGGTALQLTAIGGSIKIAKLLLQNGADIHAQPAKVDGRTPFEGAAEHGRLDMLKVIWDATFPEGISMEEASNAIHFARKNGHRVCEQYIRYLVPTTDISELSDGPRRAWRSWSESRRHNPRSAVCNMRIGDECDVEKPKWDASSDDEESSGEEDAGGWHDSLPMAHHLAKPIY